MGRPFVISDSEALRAVLLQTPEVLQLLLPGDGDSTGSSSNRNTGDEALLESAHVLLLPQDVRSFSSCTGVTAVALRAAAAA